MDNNDGQEEIMRQLRRGAPFGWSLILLLPLLVSGGLGGSTTALTRHTAVVQAIGEHQPLSRPFFDHVQRHSLVSGFTGTGTGGGGGHPFATPGTDPRHLFLAAGPLSHPAGDEDTHSLAALLVRPGRAPPASTTG